VPGGELERVLRSIFPELAPPDEGGGLGDIDPGERANVEQVPGLAYSGGPQPQRTGAAGRVAQAYSAWINAVYGGVDPTKCPPPFNSPECMDVLSRLLEGTFRNFQLTSRPPSHIAPPFSARCIDVVANEVTIPGTYGGAFTTVCTFTVPVGKWRGVVVDAGHALESLAAWADVEWRITLNGTPYEPYASVRTQIWDMVNDSKLCPIHLLPRDRVSLEARSLSSASHTAWARLSGWYYPVRSEVGGREIRATLVD
jgi:hypothetical protein